ncbi:MAG TPA: tetratricopeptide repeat protein [Thermoanaerobaculia bacterium]|nr:tetratricopeptide repeat protein [Thermoanaerobaculia bacterium]
MGRRAVRSPTSAAPRRHPAAARAASSRRGRLAGRLLPPLLAALVPLAVYWPTTGYGFVLDDTVLFRSSPSLADLGSIPRGFLTDVGGLRKGSGTVISSFYRPVFLALSTLYYQLAAGRPFAWHLAAVALACLVGALAYGFLSRLGFPPILALLASVVFSLHPAHVSSVAWASGLQELLAALFVLLALHAALWRRDGSDAAPVAAAAAAYALALLSKEVAIGLLPFAALWALGTARTDPPAARRLWKLTGAVAAVSAVYLAVRVAVLGGLAQPAVDAPRLADSLPAVPVAFAAYLRLLLWPTGFAFFRPERPRFGPLDAPVLLAVAVAAALVAVAAWAWRAKHPLLLPIAWFTAWLLPVLNLWALAPQAMVTDRYLFLPSLALPWSLALIKPRRLAVAILCLAAAACGCLAVRYSAIFENERTFLAAMETAEPTSPLVFEEKGRLLLKDGDLPGARAALTRAVELDPLGPGALLDLGDLERRGREFDAAERHYRQALVVRPYASRPFKLLALDLARAGDRVKAFSLVEEAARRWPGDFETQLLAALFRGAAGERRQAAAAFEAARRLRPGDPAVAGGLDAALARLLPTVLPQPP